MSTTDGFPVPSLSPSSNLNSLGIQFKDNGNGTGTLSGTLPASDAGATIPVTIAALGDPGGTVNQTINISVAKLASTPPPKTVTGSVVPDFNVFGHAYGAVSSVFRTAVSQSTVKESFAGKKLREVYAVLSYRNTKHDSGQLKLFIERETYTSSRRRPQGLAIRLHRFGRRS